MKTLTQFRQYYENVLKQELETLEVGRKYLLKKTSASNEEFVFVASLVACLIVFYFAQLLWAGRFFILYLRELLLLGMVFIVALWFARFLDRIDIHGTKASLLKKYKTRIMERVAGFLYPEMEYYQSRDLLGEYSKSSGIFSSQQIEYKTEDVVSGFIGATRVLVGELWIRVKSVIRRGYSFKGLFFVGDFNKNFKGHTYVLADYKNVFWGMDWFRGINTLNGELVKLEDPEFENMFSVYSNDQIEARYILSTSLMKRIVDFVKKTGQKVQLSFKDSKVYVAVSCRRDFLDPKISKTFVQFESVEAHFNDLEFFYGIVEDLNLNLRIWK